MSDFFEKLKDGAEDLWDKAKETFEGETEAENQALSGYHDLFAWADGTLLATPFTAKELSEKDAQMKTIATMMVKDSSVVAPCDATVVSIDIPANTIVLQTGKDQQLAIKVCVSSIHFDQDATVLVKAGQKVARGEPLVRFTHPIEAKSKLLLTSPQTLEEFAGQGYVPAVAPGQIKKGEIIIQKA